MRTTRRNPLAWMGIAVLALASVPVFYPLAGAENAVSATSADKPCCCSKPASDVPAPTSCCCAAQGQDCPTKKGAAAVVQDKKKDMKDMPMFSAEAMAKGKTARKAIQDHQKVLQADGT